MAFAAIAAVAAPIVGGLIGNMMGSKDRKQQSAMMQKALQELEAVGLPPDISKRVVMEEFQQVGILTPELEQDIELASSQVAGITEDPSVRQAQVDALNMLQERGRAGLGPEERAAFNQFRSEVQRDSEAKRQQVLTDMASRGMAGSGSELIASLQAGQSAADRASEEGDRLAAAASQNALQAMVQSGQMAGTLRNADLDVANLKAGAADQFNLEKFNQANMRQTRNVDRGNQAQQYNLGEKQRVADTNISQENTERQRMNQAELDVYNAKLDRAKAMSGQYQTQANFSGQNAAQKAQMGASIGSGVGTGAAGFSQSQDKQALLDRLYGGK